MPSNNPRWRDPKKRRALVARLKNSPDGWICGICGKEIQKDPTYPKGHPLSWTCDEIFPVSKYPEKLYDYSNLQPAHLICNQKKSNKVLSNKKKFVNPLPLTRDWKNL